MRFPPLPQELRFPAPGVETNPGSWPWFYRMSDALEGRLAGAAPVLVPIGESGDDECEPLPPAPRKRARRGRRILTEFLTESEIDLLVENQERSGAPALADLHRLSEVTYKRKTGFLESSWTLASRTPAGHTGSEASADLLLASSSLCCERVCVWGRGGRRALVWNSF